MILCWAAKGGSGTTVVACTLALAGAAHEPTTLVDLSGDAPSALGLDEPSAPGVSEWMASPTATAADLAGLSTPVRNEARLIPRGSRSLPEDQWTRLATTLIGLPGRVVVDAGTGQPPAAMHEGAQHSLLVTRPCYLALRRAQRLATKPTGVVLVAEPGRALGVRDVEHALAVGVIAELHYDPAVARAVDAGLLAARLPASLLQALRAAP